MKSIKKLIYGYFRPVLIENMKGWFEIKDWLSYNKPVWGYNKVLPPKRRPRRHIKKRDYGRLFGLTECDRKMIYALNVIKRLIKEEKDE